MRSLRSRLSYANVISTLCLFMLLGGGAYAASQLPKNSVGARQLKNGAVTGAKIKKGTIDSSKLTPTAVAGLSSQGPKGEPGPAGLRGATGAAGTDGDPGAYATVFASNNAEFSGTHPGFAAVERVELGVYCMTPEGDTSIDHTVASPDAFNSSTEGPSVETFTNEEVVFCEEGQLEVWTHELQRELELDETPKPESPYVNVVFTNDISFTVFAPGP